ncbi:hypothetical protein [Archaeoglobus sp.]
MTYRSSTSDYDISGPRWLDERACNSPKNYTCITNGWVGELWKGEIKLLEVDEGDETIVKWDYNFDYEELLPVLRRLKHEYGENIVASIINYN